MKRSRSRGHPNRRSIRLPGYDYSQPGAYFVTFCTYQMRQTLGRIENGRSVLFPHGKIVREEWLKTARLRSYIHLDEDECIIMPHHGHGILWILGEDGKPCLSDFRFGNPQPGSVHLGMIIGQFKAAVTKRINRIIGRPSRIWHRNYWEHIIRNEADLQRIRRYIRRNPENWGRRRYPDLAWGERKYWTMI